MFVPEPVFVVRAVASSEVLDAMTVEAGAVLRVAPDEVLVLDAVLADVETALAADSHAIVIDDTSWMAITVALDAGRELFARTASWPLPAEGFAQGMVAGLAVKVVVGESAVRFLVQRAVVDELVERFEELGDVGSTT